MFATFDAIEHEKLREQADRAEAAEQYHELVREIATGQKPHADRVNQVRKAAGKSVEELEADVGEYHKALADHATVQKAIDNQPIRRQALQDLKTLKAKERELREQLTRCRRDIEQKEHAVRIDDRLRQARTAAEGRLVDRCGDHRKTQYREIGEWMKDAARQRNDLENELNPILSDLSRAKRDLAQATEAKDESRTWAANQKIEALQAEADGLETRLADLKRLFDEAKADKQKLREAMFTP